MDKKLENKLKEEFAPWFDDLYGDPIKTCMAFGICCGDGWFPLIYKLCQDIKAANPPPDFKMLQLKEKFGGARIYCGPANEEICKLIRKAEEESYTICEDCGTKEDVTVEGTWILTLCGRCRKNNR